ncbi:MAG TPA: GNAT family N-acetyltransferase [Usitatibacter sp.]|nr:GNAT family N-acetyltransferase [Usitatibacter sp.]
MAPRFAIAEAVDPRQVAECRALFVEYQQALGVSLCFQDFDAELAGLPGDYAAPRGRLYLARDGDRAAGCVALRPQGARDGELKRLYVRPAYRGTGLGRTLTLRAIDTARAIGYQRLVLDTLPMMGAAQRLYADLGFMDIGPYTHNPVPGARFLALDLAGARATNA